MKDFFEGFPVGIFIGFCFWSFIASYFLKSCAEDGYNRAHLIEACANFDAIPASGQLSPILCKKGKNIIVVRGRKGHYRISAEEY